MSDGLYCREVRYFEVTFTIPHSTSANAILSNIENSLFRLLDDYDEVDVLIDARYGKHFETIHFTLEFANKEDFLEVYDALAKWCKEHNIITH